MSLIYLKCFFEMELKNELIVKNMGEVACFNRSTLQPYRKVMLNITLHNKLVSIDFYLMQYNTPYNGLLGRDWTYQIGVVSSTIYQCL